MNRKFSFFIVMVAFIMVGCSSDDAVKEKPAMTSEMFQGEWYSDENDTYMMIAYSSFKGSVYHEIDSIPKVGEELTGKWFFYPTNQILRMQIRYLESKNTESRDYRVVRVDGNTMVLLDMDLNAQYTYHKVVNSCELALGQSYNVNIPDVSNLSYSTSSRYVAKVNDQGKITATGSGTAFIKAISDNKNAYIKVDVEARVSCYAKELFLTIDDIISMYGTPDYSGPTESPTLVIVYNTHINDASLKYIHYRYDTDTREITEIGIKYCNNESYITDRDYLKNNFFDIEGNGTYYAKYEWLLDNDYVIEPVVDGGDNMLIYSNLIYLLTHGYN